MIVKINSALDGTEGSHLCIIIEHKKIKKKIKIKILVIFILFSQFTVPEIFTVFS